MSLPEQIRPNVPIGNDFHGDPMLISKEFLRVLMRIFTDLDERLTKLEQPK